MSQPQIITVSTKASSVPNAGHDYWFHHTLQSAIRAENIRGVTAGAQSQDSSSIAGILKYSWEERQTSSFWIWAGLRKDVSGILRISRIAGQQTDTVYHFYEGGFREFFTAALLCRRSMRSTTIFNFNLTDPWHLLLAPRFDPLRTIVVWAIRDICRKLSGHLVLTAETSPLSELFRASGFEITSIYPLFSSSKPSTSTSKKTNKPLDIAFFPNGKVEFELCEKVARALLVGGRTQANRMIFVPRWGYALTDDEQTSLTELKIPVLSGILNEADYSDLYASTVVSFFPYIGDYYKYSSSGRLLDALASGSRAYAPFESSLFATIQKLSGGGGFNPSNLENLIPDLAFEFSNRQDVGLPPPTPQETVKAILRLATRKVVPTSVDRAKFPWFSLAIASLVNFTLGFRPSLGRLIDSVAITRSVSRNLVFKINR